MIVTYLNSLQLGSTLSKGLLLKRRFAKPARYAVGSCGLLTFARTMFMQSFLLTRNRMRF